jgi:transposase-like protein
MKKSSAVGEYAHLEEWTRSKIQDFIQQVLEQEMDEFVGRKKSERQEGCLSRPKRYRNGWGMPRRIGLMGGTVSVRRPRLRKMDGFESKILPLFKRRSQELGEMLPELYLHGLSQGDFELALRGLLGKGAPLSKASIQRLKTKWTQEYQQWKRQDLSSLEVVYQWADGIYVKAGLEKEKAALLVIIGSLRDGRKVVLACESGYRESKESWMEVLRDLRNRGLKLGALTVADGHLGIWSALAELHPKGEEQRCWNHKITNVLDAMPRKVRTEAAELLTPIPYAETLQECEDLRDAFIKRYEKAYAKATASLTRDWERMVTFYRFPKEHWIHLRTTNIVESPFSAARLRTDAARRYKRVDHATVMLWKLLKVAEKRFRHLNSAELLKDVFEGKRCKDGVFVHKQSENQAA